MLKNIGNIKLNYKYYSGNDFYCDGDVENELLEIVKNYEESDYNKIITERKSWPILYHLSHIRGNIIDWLPLTKSDKVLEIGSGCGAVTGYIADKVEKVDCIELSEKRSLINAYRNKKRDNIEIFLGNFETVEKNITEKYDYITLIGVFEYAQRYISTENPYEHFLSIIKKHLKPNGKIIIAIENKLGMKYWAGCSEDHTYHFFDGIENYYNVDNIKTFSKKELEKMLVNVNLSDYEFYYPYPDYKLPMVIYSDDYLPKLGELNNNMRNFDNERIVLFDESKAFDSIIEAGLFTEFSNSFLIIAGNGGTSK